MMFKIFRPSREIGEQYKKILMLCIIIMSFLIFVYNPFLLYASDISQFQKDQMPHTLSVLFGSFLLYSFLFIYGFSFIYLSRFFSLVVYGICVLFFIALIYNFILDFNILLNKPYGILDHMNFIAPREVFNIPKHGLILVDLLVGILSMLLAIIALYFYRFFKQILYVLAITLGLLGMFYAAKIIFYSHEKTTEIKTDTQKIEDSRPITSFSNKKNVLVLVLDAFSGSHLLDIIKLYPELASELSGFSYFPNTLATSSFTFFTTHSLVGGDRAALFDIYKRHHGDINNEIIQAESKKAFLKIAADFSHLGYENILYNPEPAKIEKDELAKNTNLYYGEPFKDYFFKKYSKELAYLSEVPADFIPELINYGFFKIAPYSLRAKLYIDYGWRFAKSAKIKRLNIVADSASDILSFPDLMTLDSKRPTFKYIKSMITHQPAGLDVENSCLPTLQMHTKLPKEYMQYNLNSYMDYHFDNEICAIFSLSKMIAWMKDHGIYDQTRIIVASDHGLYDAYDQMKNNHGNELGRHSNALLMFKDFNATGDLKIDSRLMQNSDAAGFVYDGLFEGSKQYPKNILKHYPKNRKTIHVMIDELHRLEGIYEVSGDISKPDNWRKMSEKESLRSEGE